MIDIEAKSNTVMNKLGSNERRMYTAHEVGAVDEEERRKSVEDEPNHEGSYQVEETQYLNANRISNSFEDQMLTFIGENIRLLNKHEQKFAELASF